MLILLRSAYSFKVTTLRYFQPALRALVTEMNEWTLHCAAKGITSTGASVSSFILVSSANEVSASAACVWEAVTPDEACFLALVDGLHHAKRLGALALAIRSDFSMLGDVIAGNSRQQQQQQQQQQQHHLLRHIFSIQSTDLRVRFETVDKKDNIRAYELCEQCIRDQESSQASASELLSVSSRESYELYFDGGSRGNPGISGSGAVLYKNKVEIWSCAKFLGNDSTCNQAEYTGLITG